MPPKGKRNAANQHDKRHENGLAAPGKRIPKQRSNSNLNGYANGKPISSTPPLPPAVHLDHRTPSPDTRNAPALATSLDHHSMSGDAALRRPSAQRARTVSDTSHDQDDGGFFESANGALDHPVPAPTQRPHANGGRNSIARTGMASTALTIISSCPVWDVIAILIILLQLPTAVLTVIQLLFATLTFVPPHSTTSLSSLPSFSEVFKGSQGMPSLGTILLCDFLALIVGSFLPSFAQGIAFDLAQAVIAISLGGAHAGKGGVSQSVADRTPTASSVRRTDPEAAAIAQLPRTTSDAGVDSNSGSATDGRHPGPSPAGVDGRERSFSSVSKKKKRHATHVRSQQPFWAALASTKVTFCNQVQQSNESADSQEAESTDVNHIGNAHFRSGEDRVWILNVGATEINFGASVSKKGFEKEHGGEEQDSSLGAGIDKSKPFYVRLNGTNWASTNITEAEYTKSGDETMGEFSGKIFGLTAQQHYICEFVRTADRSTVYSTSLITQSAPSAEQASATPPAAHQTLRPQSPRTLLKNNVTNLEHELGELRTQQKRNQKSHGKSLASAKKDVDAVESKIQTSGGNDDRLRQKKRQLTEAIRQAEEAALEMASESERLGHVPEEEAKEFAAEERSWQAAKDRKEAAYQDLERAKAEANSELANAENEFAGLVKKRERLQARHAKLNDQHKILIQLNAQDREIQNRKLSERAALQNKWKFQENGYLNQIAGFEAKTADLHSRTAFATQQIQHLQNELYQQDHIPSEPMTPEGPLPGTTAASGAYPQVFQFAPLSGQLGGTPSSLSREGRGRSSSMLSDMSGFTDHNVDPVVHGPPNAIHAPTDPFSGTLNGAYNAAFVNGNGVRKGSSESSGDGSGSGSGSTPASQRDPTSPVNKPSPAAIGSSKKTLSPITDN
ncbi:hypothetical protein K490DRAFT_66037 [Saccharata proteae CBS 121410]|uniref:Ubiquitination network signaling protein n=1 Tax=Saccharata proteae CBS 121410 TaxID=1314787 RepID=A0A9P4HX33_9PEZI|nr:hypothetical protein K490DRAFT_66037 [Saccharata proteae CBS 121410]